MHAKAKPFKRLLREPHRKQYDKAKQEETIVTEKNEQKLKKFETFS